MVTSSCIVRAYEPYLMMLRALDFQPHADPRKNETRVELIMQCQKEVFSQRKRCYTSTRPEPKTTLGRNEPTLAVKDRSEGSDGSHDASRMHIRNAFG